MSIFWGVVGIYYDRGSTTDQLVQETIEVLQKNKIVKRGDLVINTASMPAKEKGGTNTLKISRFNMKNIELLSKVCSVAGAPGHEKKFVIL